MCIVNSDGVWDTKKGGLIGSRLLTTGSLVAIGPRQPEMQLGPGFLVEGGDNVDVIGNNCGLSIDAAIIIRENDRATRSCGLTVLTL
jgi:hypothetical protein